MFEWKTYNRLFGLRYLPAASISNVKKRYTGCIKILVRLSFLPFLFPSWFYPYELCCLKLSTTSYTKHTYICRFIYELRHKKTCILKCENKKALTKCVLPCWSTQCLKFKSYFKILTHLAYRANVKKRDISSNNLQL